MLSISKIIIREETGVIGKIIDSAEDKFVDKVLDRSEKFVNDKIDQVTNLVPDEIKNLKSEAEEKYEGIKGLWKKHAPESLGGDPSQKNDNSEVNDTSIVTPTKSSEGTGLVPKDLNPELAQKQIDNFDFDKAMRDKDQGVEMLRDHIKKIKDVTKYSSDGEYDDPGKLGSSWIPGTDASSNENSLERAEDMLDRYTGDSGSSILTNPYIVGAGLIAGGSLATLGAQKYLQKRRQENPLWFQKRY